MGKNTDSTESEENLQHVQQGNEDTNLRLMYALFILPLFIVFTVILIGYLKQCLQARVLNLIRLVDAYMTPSDEHDSDQTPPKVLEMLDAMETDDGELTNDLLWNDSIERNAHLLVNDISNEAKKNSRIQNESQLSEASIIDVNFDDYLKLFENQDHSDNQSSISKCNPEDSDHQPIGSSTPLNLCVESNSISSRSMDSRTVAKYISSPQHFPSFNVQVNISNSDISEDESDQDYSKTRSGKIYKTL